jgi:hypothetical protein
MPSLSTHEDASSQFAKREKTAAPLVKAIGTFFAVTGPRPGEAAGGRKFWPRGRQQGTPANRGDQRSECLLVAFVKESKSFATVPTKIAPVDKVPARWQKREEAGPELAPPSLHLIG